jgi:trimeric autotransporter adhesin
MANQPKSYRKFLAGSVTAALVASAVAPAASAATFSDVDPTDSHAQNIEKAVELGLVNGKDGQFMPYQDITRGQVAKIMARYLRDTTEVDTTGTAQFSDVNADLDSELAADALVVRAAGVFMGSNGNLKPHEPITRQEMASVLVRMFGFEDLADIEPSVTDNDEAWEVHRENINILSENEITNVTEYNPLENVKRAQFASFIVRSIEALEEVIEVPAMEITSEDSTHLLVTLEGDYAELTAEDFVFEGLEVTDLEYVTEAAAEGEEEVVTTTVRLTTSEQEAGKTYTLTSFMGVELSEEDAPAVSIPATPEVTGVSAITKTGVDVTFPEVTEAEESVEITVVDPSGKVIPVKPVNLEIGDTVISYEFETALTEVALGTWVVGGVEFDTKAQAAVQAVNASTNEVELLNALNSSYFTGVNADFITDYDVELDGTQTTVKEIQDIIDEVNSSSTTAEEKAAAVKAVNDATDQVKLLSALQNKVFDRVNSSWIASYQTAITGAADADKDTVTEIQALVDGVNFNGVTTAVNDALDELSLSKNSTARSLVNSYIAEDEEGVTVKATFLASIQLHDAVVNVNLANTNAKLDNALKALASLTDVIDLDTVNSKELSRYRTAIANAAVADKDTASELQTLIDTANVAAETAAVNAVAAVTAQTTTSDLNALLTTLADRSDYVAGAFDGDNINEMLLEDYRTALKDAIDTDKDSAAEINSLVVGINNPKAALDTIDALVTPTAEELLTALKDKTLNFKNLVDGNKAAYLAELADIQAAIVTTDSTTTADSLTAVKKIIDSANAKVTVNNATSASVARTALVELDLAAGTTSYINLSSLAKLEVAELILADIKANGVYADVAALETAVGTQTTAHTSIIADVNAATDIAPMDSALEGVGYKVYNDLSSVKQVEVAEAFLTAFPTKKDADGNVTRVDYTSITDIKAAVDAAIASTN